MITLKSKLEFTITLTLSRDEAAALENFVSFSTEDIERVYDEHLGTGLRKHHAGFGSLCKRLRNELPPIMRMIRDTERDLDIKPQEATP